MASRMVADDSEDIREVEVKMGTTVSRVLYDPEDDPFLKSAREIKDMAGLSPVFKRNTSRALTKVHQGVGGDARSKKQELPDITGYTMFDVVLPPYNLDYLAKLNELSAPHYAAIKAKVANIVGLGFDLVESPKTKQLLDDIDSEDKTVKARKKIARMKEVLLEWLQNCNEDDEFQETLIKVWTDYEATGNGYIEIGRKINGEIGYIGHIPATVMRIRKQRDGFVQIMSNKVVFFRNFGSDRADPFGKDPRPNEVIHIKKYSPTGNFYGVPDIIAAQTAIAGNEFSSRFNLDYFENKAVPRYVITIKGARLSPTSERNILEFFQTNLKGKNHRTLYVPLPADDPNGGKSEFKMEPIEAGTQDSSFNNYRKGNLGEILMAHRVPISKVGMAEGVSLAVARDADKTFKEQVCRPEQQIFEKKLNKIIREVTDAFVLKLNELTLTDEDTLSKMDERYLRWGVIVPNEVRARWGWTGIEDGDKPVGVMQQQEAAAAAKQVQTDASEQQSQANATRTRDAERSSNAADSDGEARQPQGAGRAV